MPIGMLARGTQWGQHGDIGPYTYGAQFFEDMPSVDVEATNQKIGDLILARFHQLVGDQGSTACWLIRSGEVIGDEEDLLSPQELDQLRREAYADVKSWLDAEEIEPVWKEDE